MFLPSPLYNFNIASNNLIQMFQSENEPLAVESVVEVTYYAELQADLCRYYLIGIISMTALPKTVCASYVAQSIYPIIDYYTWSIIIVCASRLRLYTLIFAIVLTETVVTLIYC